ncbi:MAG: DeoR/GlpR transcriptional regulator [Selenomonas sp.]|nr:DeoR/GlpR transcriptional regulator [Selenomonas sp.]
MKNSKSVVFKRQQALLKELREEKTIDVESVAKKLSVSPTTIRRDLVMFEKQNLVERFHGGATLLEESLRDEDIPTDNHAAEDKEQKHIIARYAAEMVDDGDTIFINSSSTALLMLDYLKGKRVIVVTNNGFAVNHPHDPQVDIIMTGGEIYQRRKSFVGEFALHTLTKIIADKAFIGVGGISAAGGITTSVLPETAVNETMLRRCQGKRYVLAATSKIGREHNFHSADVNQVDCLITCQGCNASELAAIKNSGVDVVELHI